MSSDNHVKLHINEELNGIELVFDEKPSREILDQLRQDRLFRWHPAKKIWYAKNTARARELAMGIIGKMEENTPLETTEASEKTEQLSSKKNESKKVAGKPNTFAAYYSKSMPISPTGKEIGLRDVRGTYIEDLNIYYHVYNNATDSTIQIIDLENAQKRGKNCTKYSISLPPSEHKDLIHSLYQLDIKNIAELWNTIKENDAKLHDISLYTYTLRGVDVFSPFVEVNPLKSVPEKWTRATLIQGLLSGQIYKGEINYRYSDDYAYDAASDFGTGYQLNLAKTALDVIENWYSTSSISGSVLDEDKTKAVLHYSTHSNASDSLYFDLNFNHEKGQAYRIEEAKAIERFNMSLKNSVIHPDSSIINQSKIYEIQLIDTHRNNGIYDTKTETIQGYLLKEYLTEKDNFHIEDLLGFKEMDIVPDKLYSVGLGYQDSLKNDPRIIQADPHTFVVTGKGLLELSQESIYLDKIHEDYNIGCTYDKVKAHIESFQSGNSFFMFSDSLVDYDTSLSKLEAEMKRAKDNRQLPLDELVSNAELRRTIEPVKEHNTTLSERV